MKVTLTAAELATAAQVGSARHIDSLVNKRRPGFRENYAGELWARHIEGACGELAFCKAYGIYWNGSVNAFGEADVGANIQIRTSENGRKLKVRTDEDDGAIVVLVAGKAPRYEIVGWIVAKEAKQDKWLSDPGGYGKPAYFVPRTALNRMEGKDT